MVILNIYCAGHIKKATVKRPIVRIDVKDLDKLTSKNVDSTSFKDMDPKHIEKFDALVSALSFCKTDLDDFDLPALEDLPVKYKDKVEKIISARNYSNGGV